MKLIVLLLVVVLVAGGWWYFSGRGGGADLPPSGYQPIDGGSSQLSPEQQNAAYDSKRKADLSMIKAALVVYEVDYDTYPEELTQLVEKGYLSSIPKDPMTDDDYKYDKTDSTYTLSAVLSDGSTYSVKP